MVLEDTSSSRAVLFHDGWVVRDPVELHRTIDVGTPVELLSLATGAAADLSAVEPSRTAVEKPERAAEWAASRRADARAANGSSGEGHGKEERRPMQPPRRGSGHRVLPVDSETEACARGRPAPPAHCEPPLPEAGAKSETAVRPFLTPRQVEVLDPDDSSRSHAGRETLTLRSVSVDSNDRAGAALSSDLMDLD